MPWAAKWQNEHERVIVTSISGGQWEWKEYRTSVTQVYNMVRGKPYVVDLIYRFDPGFSFPRSPSRERVFPWEPLCEVMANAPPNRGITLGVGAPLVFRSMMQNLKTTTKDSLATDHIKFVETMEMAQQIIEEAQAARREDPDTPAKG